MGHGKRERSSGGRNRGLSRREFLKTSAVGAAGVYVSTRAKAGSSDQDTGRLRPNIIFINADQMSGLNTISGFGCPHVRTPNIDRLIRNGVSFDRTYATDPVCVPARASWWTGRYSSEHGAVMNGIPCHRDIPDLGPLLAEHGYNGFHIGKWHADGLNVRKSFHVIHEGSWWGEITDPDVTLAARSFLRNYSDAKPFFLALGYLNPHDICLTWNQYHADGVPRLVEYGILDSGDLPPLPAQHDYEGNEPAVIRAALRGAGRGGRFDRLTELQWRKYLWNYYRHIEMVDQEIGLVLDEVENSPLRDDTLVIFSSDHGEGMACHKTIGKQTLYDEVVRVPLVWATLGDKLPIAKGRRDSTHMVSGVDFVPTVCDYAGIAPFENRGRSLRPLVEGRTPSAWRDYVFAESSFYSRMVCTRDYKYIMEYVPGQIGERTPPGLGTHEIGGQQLFDLNNDPGETRNLAYTQVHQQTLEEHRTILVEHEAQLVRRQVSVTWPPAVKWLDGLAEKIKSLQ